MKRTLMIVLTVSVLSVGVWFLFVPRQEPASDFAASSPDGVTSTDHDVGESKEGESQEMVAEPSRRQESPLTVEPDPTEDQGQEQDEATDQSEAQLKELGRTFLTDQPDRDGLDWLLTELSISASVVTESVEIDRFGVVRGDIALEGSELVGCFRIEGNSRLVKFRIPANDGRHGKQDVSIRFSNEASGDVVQGGTAVVQFHPNLHSADFSLEEGEEAYVGWGISVTQEGTSYSPLTVRRGPRGWQIGHSKQLSDREETFSNPEPFQAWQRVLANVSTEKQVP